MIIMSNNLWNNDSNQPLWAARGEDCSAEGRIGGLIRAYRSVMPDILGFQEMSRHMEQLVMERMKETETLFGEKVRYEIVTGGFTPLLFRYDRYCLLESGHRLYNKAFPPYSGAFNDADSKGYTFGVFENRNDGKRIIVLTTHLWWKSDDPENKNYQEGSGLARAFQIQQAAKCAEALSEQYDCPAILLGDLNDELGSPALNAVLSGGWQETHTLCVGERNDTRGYHYCFADGWHHDVPGEYVHAIDHILIHNPRNVIVNRFCRIMEPYYECLSDHFPVYIDLSL